MVPAAMPHDVTLTRAPALQPQNAEYDMLCRFDSFCKRVVRNERRNIDRERKRRRKNQSKLYGDVGRTVQMDRYPSEQLTVKAGAFQCSLQDESLHRAMNDLPENRRGAIIAQFWYDWGDNRIAENYRVGPRSIRKWRNKSYQEMRSCLKKGA